MLIERTAIADVLLIKPRKHGDHRGFFSETFKASELREVGVTCEWVQDNHSYSVSRGVVRGLHFQAAPSAQAKLIRTIRGAAFDVALDIRVNSPTYGQHVAVELSADNWAQLYVPVGFAHGFCTLSPDTEMIYKVSAPYAPGEEGGVLWNDPELGIAWPVSPDEAVLSERDWSWPPFNQFVSSF